MWKDVLSSAAGQIDRAVTAVVSRRRLKSRAGRAEALPHADRLVWLRRTVETYARDPHVDRPEEFFAPARPVRTGVQQVAVRSIRPGGRVLDLSWPSRFSVWNDEVADVFLEAPDNARAAVRAYLHNDRPRPSVILVHGYLGGTWRFEERAWPIRWLHGLGLDVYLFVLPFHAVRADTANDRKVPVFPGSDPRVTIEGFRQTVIDVRDLVSHILDGGAPSVGLMGISLGGYTTALLSTLEPRLRAAVCIIPLASLADFARDHGRLVGSREQQDLQHEGLEAAYRAVSPLSRPLRLEQRQMRIFAARGDRITPIAHAERIAKHFDVPIHALTGGHLLQFDRGEVYRGAARLFASVGMLGPR